MDRSVTLDRMQPAEVLGLLAAQRDLYRKLLDLDERSGDLGRMDVDAVSRLVEEKVGVMAEVARIDDALAIFKEVWSTWRHEIDAGDKLAIDAAMGEVRGVLERLIAVETASSEQLRARMEEARGRFQEVEVQRRATDAYGVRPAGPARFVDTTQ